MLLVNAWSNQGNVPLGWGSQIIIYWKDFESLNGQYGFSKFDYWLAKQNRPCYLQIGFSFYDEDKKVPIDVSPDIYKSSIILTSSTGQIGYIPDYNPIWVQAYINATTALGQHYKDHPQVMGYWHSAGWNLETQAAVNWHDDLWADMYVQHVTMKTYFDFLELSTKAATEAWQPKTVWLQAVPSPGTIWGSNQRRFTKGLLNEHVGYMHCGLGTDIDIAIGLENNTGIGNYEMHVGRNAPIGFEEGPRFDDDNPLEVYWFLMHALHYNGEFVNLYMGISGTQAQAIEYLLPTNNTRWMVFRDRESEPIMYTGSNGLKYGWTGEPGQWGKGLTWLNGGTLVFDNKRYDMGRWQLQANEPILIGAIGLANGLYNATVYYPDGTTQILQIKVNDETFILPEGNYHRVDIGESIIEPQPEPLPNDEPIATVDKLRWWLEELARMREAGNEERVTEILYSLIELAYRVDNAI